MTLYGDLVKRCLTAILTSSRDLAQRPRVEISCQEVPYRDLINRSAVASLSRGSVQKSLPRDLVWSFLGIPVRDLVQRSTTAILPRDLSETLWRHLLHRSLAEFLPRDFF